MLGFDPAFDQRIEILQADRCRIALDPRQRREFGDVPGWRIGYPDIAVELVVDDGLVDIVADRFDCGVRHAQTLQADMISVRISTPVPLAFVAAPVYLAERAAPVDPDDLIAHRCLCYRYTSSGVVHRWEFERDGRTLERSVRGDFTTNDIDAMRDAAVAGLGVTCLPLPHAALHLANGTLVEVLAGWAPTLAPNHLYYPSRRQPTAAFQAFVTAMRV